MRTARNGDVGIRAAGYEGVIAEFFAELKRLGEQRPEEAQANGRLFLAAPDLLAACEATRPIIKARLEMAASRGLANEEAKLLAVLVDLDAAIAKAVGK